MAPRTESTLDAVLEFVKESRGFDFTGYKRASIQRRVAKRMADVGVENYDDYIDHLALHSEEFAQLFNAILINVTGFFRDPQTWEHLATDVVPQLIAARPKDTPLRVWCAGCASGEEPYTVAMLFARAIGDAAFRERVKIYATDVDDEALDFARQGVYSPRQIEDVPRDALERFFDRTDQRYVFRKDLRRCVIFGRNDLVQDAPISRIDLLLCRNTLMYFTADTQSQVLRRFHFALDDEGFLVLGKSEMLITHAELFTPVGLKWRVFHKVLKPGTRDHRPLGDPGLENGESQSVTHGLREAAFDVGGAGQIVLDAQGMLAMANDTARRMFGLGNHDFGRPVQDLELSYRPAELRPHLDTVASGLRAVDIKAVPWRVGANERVLDILVAPLVARGVLMGTSITYVDVSERHRLRGEVTSSKRELEEAHEELQSTVEELETTNEELQSTNEELETTNEELQSSNEELETTNEELQSSNEELETINEELRHRSGELNEMNAYLETILSTIGLAVAVLDRLQHVRIWNAQAHELWGLTAEDVEDQHVMGLDFGLPVERLKASLRSCLTGASAREEIVLDATNRRGNAFQCRVTCLALGEPNDGLVAGAIMMMEPVAA